MISKTRSRLTFRRFMRVALAAMVAGSMLLATPLSPAWAKKRNAMNSGVVPQADSESNVTGYIIVVFGVMLGMTAICRKSYRTTDPKRIGTAE